jgi:asparagine synthase (glutamine-hydrolysing)
LLMRVDKVTMSVGVEAREPFMDYTLVEYLMTLPQSTKLNGWRPKHLLKQAMTNVVPAEIIARPKQAFAAPINAWMHAGLDAFVRRGILESKLRERGLFNYDYVNRLLDEHSSRRGDHGVALWTFLNLSAWYDHWIAGSPGGAGVGAAGQPPNVALAPVGGGTQ